MPSIRSFVACSLVVAAATPFVDALEIPFGLVYPIHDSLDGAAAMAVADLDRDGLDDVVLAAIEADTIAIRFNGTPGSWTALTVGFDEAVTVTTADVDGDGWIDVVGGKRGTGANAVRWWKNPGAGGGTWVENPIVGTTISGVRSVVAGDMDNDGDVDLVSASFTTETEGFVTIFENTNGEGTAWTLFEVDVDAWGAHTVKLGDINGAEKVRIVDLNHDGHLDLIAIGSRADSLAWYEFDFIGSYTRHLIDTSIDGVIDFDLGDFDCNGDLDIAVASFLGEEIRFWENTNGDGSSWSLRVSGSLWSGASAVQVVDIDHEDGADVIVAHYGADTVSAYLNVDCGFSYSSLDITTAIDGPIDLEVGDFNQDGWEDVAVAASAGDTLDVFLNQNGTSWFKYGAATDIGGISSLSAADFDFDGAPDLVATASTGGEVLRWKNHNGNGTSWIPMGVVTDTLMGAAAVTVAW